MATIASNKGGGGFIPCPTGPQRIVCCDIIDHGWIQSTYMGKPKVQHKVTIRFQSERKMADGKPYIIGRRFTLSLKENSALRPFLNSWRGVPLSEAECAQFDLDRLIGVNAYGNVTHESKSRGIFAEVTSIMPLPAGYEKLTVSPDYKLVRDQTPEELKAAAAAASARQPGEDTPDAEIVDKPPF